MSQSPASALASRVPTAAGRATGSCSVCLKPGLRLTGKGLVYNHGHRSDDPCPGIGKPPYGSTTPASQFLRDSHIQPQTPALAPPRQQSIQLGAHLSQVRAAPKFAHPCLNGPAIKWIPRAARQKCAILLSSLIKAVLQNPQDADVWLKLLQFAPVILSKPARGGQKNLTNVITRRIANFPSTEGGTAKRGGTAAKVRERRNEGADSRLARSVSSKLEEGNFKGAVRLICSEDSQAVVTDETVAALRLKHPSAPTDRRSVASLSTGTTSGQFSTCVDDVRKAIFSFPAGSSGGPDGLTPQHLRDLVSTEGENSPLLALITDLVNGLYKGIVPEQVRPVFFGGRLIALAKKDGGLRPIAIGYTLRRLAAKVANTYATRKLSPVFSPLQLGVGSAGGMEAAVHATRRYLQHLPSDHSIVKLDFRNAFNTLRRDALLEATQSILPELFTFVTSAYSASSILQFGGEEISSSEGVQQGDPVGPLLFSMTIQPLLTNCASELRIGYLDDITLGGPTVEVASDVIQLKAAAFDLGLELNDSKCELIQGDTLATAPIPFKDFSTIAPADAMLLGSPLSADRALMVTLEKRVRVLERGISRLKHLHSHDALVILKHSFSLPVLLHNLRSSPCANHRMLVEFDEALRTGLSQILNIDLDDGRWTQASLPVRDGGLGIRSAVLLAPSAFLASAAGTSDLISIILPSRLRSIVDPHIASSLQVWNNFSQSAIAPTGFLSHKQRAWDDLVVKATQASLLAAHLNAYDQARLKAAFSLHSGAWLNAPPITSVGLRLNDESIRVAVGLRLGAALCTPHTCPCGTFVDSRGNHGLACRRSAGRQLRHTLINDVIWRAMGRAQIAAVKEPSGLSTADMKRPDGATIIPWARGKCLAWDATTPDTVAASHIAATQLIAGAAADRAASLKSAKYSFIDATHLFVPVAVETLGPWNTDSLNFILELGRRVSAATGDPRETAFLLQRVSVAVQRGNAASFAGCLPDPAEHAPGLSPG
jgi:hypothetical protein